jgi:HAT1-interacting factor 1
MAEAHYKLSMVLDLTSGRLSDAIIHAEKARESVIARLNVLRGVIQNGEHVQVKDNGKGKGKASEGTLDDDLKGLGKEEVISQIKEFEDLENDLALKVYL